MFNNFGNFIDNLFNLFNNVFTVLILLFFGILFFTMYSALHTGYVTMNQMEQQGYDFNTTYYALMSNTGCRQLFDPNHNEIQRVLKFDGASESCTNGNVNARRAFNESIKYSRGFNTNNALFPYIFVIMLMICMVGVVSSWVYNVVKRNVMKIYAMFMWVPVSLMLFIVVFGNYSDYGVGKDNHIAVYPVYYNQTTNTYVNLPYTYIGKLQYLHRNRSETPFTIK